MPSHSEHRQRSTTVLDGKSQWNGNTEGLLLIGRGVSGILFALDESRVVKVCRNIDHRSVDDIDTERRAYRNLARRPSDYVLRCYDSENPYGIVLERCKETVRHRIRSRHSNCSPQREALKWAIEAARGLGVVHGCGVIQGDVGCHNMLLGSNGTLKIADFAGSLVNGYGASVDYEVGSRLPGESEPTVKTDLFALGSAIYEMITGTQPYKGRSYTEIQRLYKQNRFPDSDLNTFPDIRNIVKKCWQQAYDNSAQVLYDLEKVLSRQRSLALNQERANSIPVTGFRNPTAISMPKQPLDETPKKDLGNDQPNREAVAHKCIQLSKKKSSEKKLRGQKDSAKGSQNSKRVGQRNGNPTNSLFRLIQIFWFGH